MIPDRRAAEIDMKISIGSSSANETVLLYFWLGDLRRFGLDGLVGRPDAIRHPADLLDDGRRRDVLGELGLGDLEAYQVVDLVFARLLLEVLVKLVYVHAVGLLTLHVDNIQLILST